MKKKQMCGKGSKFFPHNLPVKPLQSNEFLNDPII